MKGRGRWDRRSISSEDAKAIFRALMKRQQLRKELRNYSIKAIAYRYGAEPAIVQTMQTGATYRAEAAEVGYEA